MTGFRVIKGEGHDAPKLATAALEAWLAALLAMHPKSKLRSSSNPLAMQFFLADLVELMLSRGESVAEVRATVNTAIAMAELKHFGEVS